jgi:hypothetical protein
LVAVNIRRARWAGVEFQPDLKCPRAPIRLGLVLHEAQKSGESRVIVIGRMPKIDARPEGFEKTSETTMQIASKWVRIMAKEAFDGPSDQLFERLAEGWHWNLYTVQPVNVRLAERTVLLNLAKSLFKEFVGEPFAAPVSAPRRRRTLSRPHAGAAILATPPETPPPWMLDEIMRHRLGTHPAR